MITAWMGFMITADLYLYRIPYSVCFGSSVLYRLTNTGNGIMDVTSTVQCKKRPCGITGGMSH